MGEYGNTFLMKTALIFSCITLLAGCFSFSSYQTARMLEPKQSSITISYNHSKPQNEEDDEFVTNIIEGQARVGISDKLEAGVKYGRHSLSLFEEEDGDISFNFTSVDAKVSIIPNHIAFSIPLGYYWIEDEEEKEEFLYQLGPGFIFSHQYQNSFEITGAVKYLIFSEDEDFTDEEGGESDKLGAFNLGLAFSNNLSRWAIRPEIGFLFNPEEVEEGYFFQYGIGVFVKLGSLEDNE